MRNAVYAALFAAVLVPALYAAAMVPLPDLTVPGLSATVLGYGPCMSRLEKYVSFQMNVSNIGNATAANFTDRLRIYGPTNKTSDFPVSSLPAGSLTAHSAAYCLRVGNYSAYGNADWFYQVNESNEGNNENSLFFQVV